MNRDPASWVCGFSNKVPLHTVLLCRFYDFPTYFFHVMPCICIRFSAGTRSTCTIPAGSTFSRANSSHHNNTPHRNLLPRHDHQHHKAALLAPAGPPPPQHKPSRRYVEPHPCHWHRHPPKGGAPYDQSRVSEAARHMLLPSMRRRQGSRLRVVDLEGTEAESERGRGCNGAIPWVGDIMSGLMMCSFSFLIR